MLESYVSRLEDKIDMLMEEINDLKSDLRSKECTIDKLEREVSDLTIQIFKLEGMIISSTAIE